MSNSVLIGADPEILLVKDNKFVSVEGLIGGTKSVPVPIPDMPSGFMMQEDNVMLEFNIPPCETTHDFHFSVESALERLSNIMSEHGIGLAMVPSGEYDEALLDTPQGSQFGCSPDSDAYLRGTASAVRAESMGQTRAAGGHVHLGYIGVRGVPELPGYVVAQLCDATLGLDEIRRGVSQGARRASYGTAGRYRDKPYGIEYRTLANNWIFRDSDRVARAALQVGELLKSPDLVDVYNLMPWTEIQRAINTEDVAMARDLAAYIEPYLERSGLRESAYAVAS